MTEPVIGDAALYRPHRIDHGYDGQDGQRYPADVTFVQPGGKLVNLLVRYAGGKLLFTRTSVLMAESQHVPKPGECERDPQNLREQVEKSGRMPQGGGHQV